MKGRVIRPVVLGILTLAIVAVVPALAFAQDFERIAPRKAPSGPAGRVEAPPTSKS